MHLSSTIIIQPIQFVLEMAFGHHQAINNYILLTLIPMLQATSSCLYIVGYKPKPITSLLQQYNYCNTRYINISQYINFVILLLLDHPVGERIAQAMGQKFHLFFLFKTLGKAFVHNSL